MSPLHLLGLASMPARAPSLKPRPPYAPSALAPLEPHPPVLPPLPKLPPLGVPHGGSTSEQESSPAAGAFFVVCASGVSVVWVV